MNMWHRKLRSFSLPEVITVIVVIAALVPPTLGIINNSVVHRREALQFDMARRYLSSVLETVLADVYSSDSGLGMNAVVQANYSGTLSKRLAGIDTYYQGLGVSYSLTVSSPVTKDGTPGNVADNNYRYITVIVSWIPAGGSQSRQLSASVLAAQFPTGITATPDPAGYTTVMELNGTDGYIWRRYGWAAGPNNELVYTMQPRRWLFFYPLTIPQPAQSTHIGITIKPYGQGSLPPGISSYSLYYYFYNFQERRLRFARIQIPVSKNKWSTKWIDVGSPGGKSLVGFYWANNISPSNDIGIAIGKLQVAR